MRRREFLRVIGGAAAWPVAAHAQRGRMPLVLVWLGGRTDDPETQRRHNVFRDAMYELGWIDRRTVRLEYVLPPTRNSTVLWRLNWPRSARM